MIVTKHFAHIVDGLVVVHDYSAPPADGAPVAVAVEFSSHVEWAPPDFEGPPAMVRSYEVVVHSYEGRVVGKTTREERIMSDVWAMVTYAVVRKDNGDFVEKSFFSSDVDASPALVATWHENTKLEAAFAKVRAKVRAEREAVADAKREAATPHKGKTIKVVKGRKVPKGTTGECIWFGAGKSYSHYGAAPMRVGLKDASGTVHWTAASNVEVVA